jgi:replicative DNA helicase
LATTIAAGLLANHDFAVDWWYVDGHERDVYDQFVSRLGGLHRSYLDRPQQVSKDRRAKLEERKLDGASCVKAWEDDDRLRIFAEGEPDIRRIKMETKRRAAQLDRPYMVVVDYIQRVDAGFTGEGASRKNIKRSVRTLNDLKSLDNTVIFGLGQFNRKASGGGMPKLRQARGSSQIEDDANHALIWHRPAKEEESDADDGKSEKELRFGRLEQVKSKHTDERGANVYADLARVGFTEWSESYAKRMVSKDRDEGWL